MADLKAVYTAVDESAALDALRYEKHNVVRIVAFCFSLIDKGNPLSIGSIASSVFPFNASVLASPRIIPGLFGYISNASLYVFSAKS